MDNFSYVFGLPDHHHASLEFADVQVGTDNRLFVDPARIHLAALAGYSWAMEADALIQSFFNTLYDAAAQRDFEAVRNLTIDTCGELNETQLGLIPWCSSWKWRFLSTYLLSCLSNGRGWAF